MKKIFTLVFSLGLLTAAFAQGGHRQQDYNSNNGSVKQSWYQGDQQKFRNDQSYQAKPNSTSDNWNYQSNDRGKDQHFGNQVNDRDGFGDKKGMGRSFDKDRFNDRRFHKRMNNRYSETYRSKPGLEISLSFGSRHK
jgi:hypothetical protein